MRWRTLMCLATCCLVAVSTALAQGFRGPGPGGPRGPGFGGPGGGDPLGSIALLGIPEVQQELKLSDEQKPKVTELLGKTPEQSRSIFEGFNFPDTNEFQVWSMRLPAVYAEGVGQHSPGSW